MNFQHNFSVMLTERKIEIRQFCEDSVCDSKVKVVISVQKQTKTKQARVCRNFARRAEIPSATVKIWKADANSF